MIQINTQDHNEYTRLQCNIKLLKIENKMVREPNKKPRDL